MFVNFRCEECDDRLRGEEGITAICPNCGNFQDAPYREDQVDPVNATKAERDAAYQADQDAWAQQCQADPMMDKLTKVLKQHKAGAVTEREACAQFCFIFAKELEDA